VRWFRRKKFVINKKLQFRFLLIILCYVGIFVLVIFASLFAPLILQLRHADVTSVEASEAALRILYLHDKFWLPVFFTLIAIALHSLHTTHKIAGPLYRFRLIFDAIKAGALPKPARLRASDYLHPELNVINGMLEALRERIGQMQRDAEKLHETLSRYGELSNQTHRDATADGLWDEIIGREKQLHETLKGFEIER
jgi:hypothetical protein